MNCHDAQAAMHGYLDRELDPTLSLDYERHVGECPVCSKALAEQQAMQAEMKAESFYYQAPQDLRDRVRASLKKQAGIRPTRFHWGWVAAAACVVLCVGLGFLLARITPDLTVGERLSREVASAHIRSLQAQHIVDVPSSDRHEVKPWFNGKLDFSPPTPDLDKEGFRLVGGRLDYLNGRPVAAIVYKRREHLINFFVWPDSPAEATDIQLETRQGYHLIHWSKAGMSCWLVSDLNPSELNELAQRLRQ